MKALGAFRSVRWGYVDVMQGTYGMASGPTAIVLYLANGEKLANLSVNMVAPGSDHDSRDLPKDCFYCNTQQEETKVLATEALASGLFVERTDLPRAATEYLNVPAWQIVGRP